MNIAVQTLAPPTPSKWLAWLRRELAPFPGRDTMVVRLMVTVVLVTIISMSLQVPEAALSAFMVFFVTKENRVLTAITGIIMIIGVTLALTASLFLYRLTFDHPELRIPVMALTVFAAMYLSRVFVLGPLGFAIGFIIAVTQNMGEGVPNAEVLVRALLWVWVAIVYPIALTVVLNQILLPAHPWKVLTRSLTQRLDAATSALQRALTDRAAGGRENAALLELATRGSSPLYTLLHFAELKNPAIKHQHASHVSAILASERLAAAAAALEMRTRQSLSPADLLCIESLLAELARLRTALENKDFSALATHPPDTATTIPELLELQSAIASFRNGLISQDPANAPAAAKTKKSLFTPDAFTNPAHTRFAFKVTLGAMSCYLLYTALDWPGIHTAFITCCFIALENTGATMRKGWLRITGCLTGALLGFLSIMYLVPQMESIVSLILLTAAATVFAGWVAAGSERIAYAGLQIAFAFYMCLFQGFAPGTDFDTIRDRIAGIILGITVSSLIFRYLWPERAIDHLRNALAQVLRGLSQLLLIPKINAPLDAEIKSAADLRAQITKHLDETLKLSEQADFEDEATPTSNDLSPPAVKNLIHHSQALCLLESLLSGELELHRWQQLDQATQSAEAAFRTHSAEHLNRIANFVTNAHPPDATEFTNALATWNTTLPTTAQNNRSRLLQHLAQQIHQLT